MCCQTLVAVIQAIMQEQHAIAEDEKEIKGEGRQEIAKKRSRYCKVRISTFVEQRLLAFWDLNVFKWGL
jgi:hypothetical protein